MAINIITGFRSSSREALDKRYGPYDSLQDAIDELGNDKYIGLKIGVVSNPTYENGNYIGGDITEYIFDGNVSDPPTEINSAAWGAITGDITSQTDLQDQFGLHFLKSEHLHSSSGVSSAGMPIKLDQSGLIDISMIPMDSGWTNQGQFTPVAGTEYPDTTGLPSGSFWSVIGVDATNGYTFVGGDLTGEVVKNGNLMIWAAGVWSIKVSDLNPFDYYKLDGTNPLTAAFAAGGFQLKNIADGTDGTDAASITQLNTKINKAGGTFTGPVIFNDAITQQVTGTATKNYLNGSSEIIGKITAFDGGTSADNFISIQLLDIADPNTILTNLVVYETAGRVEINDEQIALASDLSGKENALGNPASDGMILSSTAAGVRSWISAPNSAVWGSITGTLSNQTDLVDEFALKADLTYVDTELATKAEEIHTHVIGDITGLQDDLNLRYYKSDFLNFSTGATDANKPVKLNASGFIDTSMLDASAFYYVGSWDPSDTANTGCDPINGCEYPDPTSQSTGAFWDVSVLLNPTDITPEPENKPFYTFAAGELTGRTIFLGDFLVFGSSGWSIMSGQMNPQMYYRIDGANPLIAPFNAGQQTISNIADGVDDTDGASVKQVNTVDARINTHESLENPHGINKSMIGLDSVDNTSDVDKPISTATQTALDGKAPTSHIHHTDTELVLENQIVANVQVGGVAPGEIFAAGHPLEQILKQILRAYVSPVIGELNSVSTALDQLTGTVYEVGFSVADTLLATSNLGSIINGDGSADTPLQDSAAAPVFSGTGIDPATGVISTPIIRDENTWTASVDFAEGTAPYYDSDGTSVVIPEIDDERVAETLSSSLTLTGVIPRLHGMSATDYFTDATDIYADLSKDVSITENDTDYEYALQGTDAYIYFAVQPTHLISKIVDGNGFDVTTSFTHQEVSVVAPGWTEALYVYRSNAPTSVDPEQTYTITVVQNIAP
jgi:hypothetical protein